MSVQRAEVPSSRISPRASTRSGAPEPGPPRHPATSPEGSEAATSSGTMASTAARRAGPARRIRNGQSRGSMISGSRPGSCEKSKAPESGSACRSRSVIGFSPCRSSMNRSTEENSYTVWSIEPPSGLSPAHRVRRDDQRRRARAEAHDVVVRRRHVVVEAAEVVPDHHDGGAGPVVALHDRVDVLDGPVLAQRRCCAPCPGCSFGLPSGGISHETAGSVARLQVLEERLRRSCTLSHSGPNRTCRIACSAFIQWSACA